MKNTKLPSIMSILILTAITSVMWVSFSVYSAFTTKPAPVVPQEVSEPLTPTLNQSVMSEIESKLFFNDSQIPQLTISPNVQAIPTASISATPEASASATP